MTTVVGKRLHSGGLLVFVAGRPMPQGSMKAFIVAGKARLTHDKGGDLAVWRSAITQACRQVWADHPPLDGPVVVVADFYVPRPKSAPKRVLLPAKRPDVDKLARAALDALKDASIYGDDGQVVTLTASKFFASPVKPMGLNLHVRPVEEP